VGRLAVKYGCGSGKGSLTINRYYADEPRYIIIVQFVWVEIRFERINTRKRSMHNKFAYKEYWKQPSQ
jgi:hypothetical protein